MSWRVAAGSDQPSLTPGRLSARTWLGLTKAWTRLHFWNYWGIEEKKWTLFSNYPMSAMTPWCQIGCTVWMEELVQWLQDKFSKSSCPSIQEATKMKDAQTCGSTSEKGWPASRRLKKLTLKDIVKPKKPAELDCNAHEVRHFCPCLNACVRQNACMKAHHTTRLYTKWLNIAATCTTALKLTIYKSLWKLAENSSASIWL